VPLKTAMASHGLAIFAKYIPGKAWTVLGRAAYISAQGFPMLNSSLISIKAQIMVIWTGFILGLIPYVILQGFTRLSVISIIFTIAATLFLMIKKIQNFILILLSKLIKKKIEMPVINFKQLYKIAIYYFVYWFFLMIGFFLLVLSLYSDASIIVAFVFPMAVVLGVLAIILPGGLGVREGIMIGYLGLVSIPIKVATSISVLARLWFIIGEIFIFCVAFIMNRKKRVYTNTRGITQ